MPTWLVASSRPPWAWGAVAVATGRGYLVYRNADGTTRVSDYYSFNVFENRNGRWVYAAAFSPDACLPLPVGNRDCAAMRS